MLSDNLKQDLISEKDMEIIFQRHIIEGKSFYFNDILRSPEREFELRRELSHALKISIRDTLIVGSAKIGFSIKTHDFTKFDDKFKKTSQRKHKSDIDIAIVSQKLFDELSEQLYKFTRHYDRDWISENWRINNYYSTIDPTKSKLPDNFFYYYAKGWFRPDYLPESFPPPWKETVSKWRDILNRKISIGLYRDWKHLKNYQTDHLEKIKYKIKEMEI
ncbi:hypothetical protein L2088_16325 [Pseudomonas protegens]|uniref:hypothetical protein n=1 Tax=Pseudomonas protegens TaxID=380021 RepID=UPI002024A397|nr:hypothetical protein [Pseudomonas protegens]MCL9656272.1 hypothetical protein [Pseudomonas protegens]